MRNEGTEDHLRQCTALLTAEIDAGRAGMVRSLHSPRRPSTASGQSGNALSLRARAERGRIAVRTAAERPLQAAPPRVMIRCLLSLFAPLLRR
jgi:hypothetical protein